jgi:hypothetical protein
MKTRNTKGKTIAPLKAVSAKKKGPAENTPSRASSKKKSKPAGKRSEKPPEKGKESVSLTKALKKSLKVRKKLPLSPAKKTSESKPAKKPAGTKAKTVDKKIATPKTAAKTAAKKPRKGPLPKSSAASGKTSAKTKEKISEKTKIGKAAGTKKSGVRVLKPVAPKKLRKVGGTVKGPEKKSTSGEKGDKASEDVYPMGLPVEYGENELIVMAVDPNVVFVDWEIKKEEAPETKGGFTMRVFDVTGGESVSLGADVFFDIEIEGRVGCGFFELGMPGREVAMQVGLNINGKFLPILHSPIVSMPRLLASDELGIAKKMFGSAMPVGY